MIPAPKMGRLRDRASGLARRLALRVIDRAVGAGQRISDFADAVRPALGAADEIEVQETQSVPAPAPAPAPVPSPEIRPAPPKPPRPRNSEDIRWELARHLSQDVAIRVAAMLDADPWTDDGGHDAEALRKMRIASRRLRTFVELFGAKLPPKLERRLRRNLRRITKALGPLRDWDVYSEALHARLAGAGRGDAAAIEHVLEDITRRRDEARDSARSGLEAVDTARLRRDLDRATGVVITPFVQMKVEASTEAWSMLRPRVEETLQFAAATTDLDDQERVHELRIFAKRLRYAYDLLGPAFDDVRRAREPLKRVQRVIGDARDRQLLVDFVETHRSALHAHGRPHLAAGLMPLLATIATEAAEARSQIPEAIARLDERQLKKTQAALGARPVAVVPPQPRATALGSPGRSIR